MGKMTDTGGLPHLRGAPTTVSICMSLATTAFQQLGATQGRFLEKKPRAVGAWPLPVLSGGRGPVKVDPENRDEPRP